MRTSAVLVLLLLVSSGTRVARAQDGLDSCHPSCRQGFVCVSGRCVSPCNPPCSGQEICTRTGKCIPSTPGPARPVVPPRERRRVATTSSEPPRSEETVAAKEPFIALLINPFAIVLTPIVAGIGVVPLEIQLAGRYAGVGIQGGLYLDDGSVIGGLADLGLRILPQGRGLHGFYLVPRVGFASAVLTSFVASFEVGYGWFFGNFVLNVGGGVVYTSGDVEYPVLPFGNLSIGVGG